jgi:hypothetical protein
MSTNKKILQNKTMMNTTENFEIYEPFEIEKTFSQLSIAEKKDLQKN